MTSYHSLASRTAVVTGAASGMGAATARLLAASGARVALLSRRTDRLQDLAAQIVAAGGDALAVPVDVTDPTAVRSAVGSVHDRYGVVDLVVNNAGVLFPNPVTAGREDQWLRMIDTNLTGALRIAGAFIPDLVAAAAAGRTADLVAISSVAAHVAFPNYAVYGATKAAVTQLSAALRAELAPLDVRVTNIEPGVTETEIGSGIDNPDLIEELAQYVKVTGSLSADEVADVVGFIASRPRHVNLRQVLVLPTRQV